MRHSHEEPDNWTAQTPIALMRYRPLMQMNLGS